MEYTFSRILSRNKWLSLIQLGRPWNALLTGLLALLGILLIPQGIPSSTIALGAFFTFFFAYMAGATVNDIFDILVDSINMPYRPLQQKTVSKKEAWLFSLIMHAVALGLSFMLDFKLFLLVIAFFVLSIFYSIPPVMFSRRSIWGQVELVVCTISLPIYSGIVLASNSFLPPVTVIPALSTLSLFFIFLLILKDFKDILGDEIKSKGTFVSRKGETKALMVMVVGSVVFFSLTTLFFYQIFNNLFFILVSNVILIFLLKTELQVISSPEIGFTEARIIMLFYVLSLLAFSFLL